MSYGSYSFFPTGSGRRIKREWSGSNGRSSENAYNMVGVMDERFPFVTYDRSTGAVLRSGHDGLGISEERWMHTADGTTENRALAKLVDALRGHQFNAGIALATGHQTLSTLVGLVGSLVNGYRAFRRGDVESAIRHFLRSAHASPKTFKGGHKTQALSSSDVSSLWLSIQYAWGPLVNDIYESAKAVEKRYSPNGKAPPAVFKARATTPPTLIDHAMSGQDRVLWFSHRVHIEYRVEIIEQVGGLAHELGLTNPALVAWDLFPASFVLDWAVPIGTYLDNRSYLGGFQTRVCKTTYEVATADIRNRKCIIPLIGSPFDLPHRYECCGRPGSFISETWSEVARGGHICRYVRMKREVNIPLVVPPPSLKAVEKIFSTGHLANSAALIHGLLASARR